jgi:hypothetical protein
MNIHLPDHDARFSVCAIGLPPQILVRICAILPEVS